MNSDQLCRAVGGVMFKCGFKVIKMIYWLETDKKPHNLETESYTQGAYCQHIENTI